MEYEIFSIGDPAFLAETLKATTTILNRDGLTGIVAIGFLFTFVWTIVQGVLSGGKEIKIQNIVIAGMIYAAFFGVKVERMNVWALNGMELHQVEDVPLGLAFTGTVISKIGNEITDWFEQEYTTIGMSTSDMGTSFALKTLYEMRGLGFNDGSLKWDPNGYLTKTLNNYIADCVVPGTTVGTEDPSGNSNGLPAINLKKAFMEENAWEHLKWNNNVYTTLVYPFVQNDPTPGQETQVKTCAEAHDYVTQQWINNPAVIANWMGNIGEGVCNEAGYSCEEFKTTSGEFDTTSFNNSFSVIRNSILGSDVSLDKMMLNRALILPMTQMAPQEIGHGDALISAVTARASAQMTANQALQQTMFEKMMMPLMTFFEALMFVAAPFAAILVAFGMGGIGMIGKYIVFALWIQLWKPVVAVGNMFIQMSVAGEMSNLSGFEAAKGSSLAALANQPQVFDALQHWIGVGGMLVAATPAITLMLMYGSAITASSLASRIDAGKGSSVGMDDFSGKSQIGDASASLTQNNGAVAFGNNQTQDATQGSISLSSTLSNQAQTQSSIAQSETKRAEEARTQALQSTHTAATQVGSANVTGTTADGREVGSKNWAETTTDRIAESEELSNTEQSAVTAGVMAKANAGFDFGKIMGRLKDNGVDTSRVKGKGHLGMIMSAMGGKVEGGAEYNDRFQEAAANTEKLTSSVDKAWAQSEQQGIQWGSGFQNSENSSLTQNESWQQGASQTQTATEATTKAKSAEARAAKMRSMANQSSSQQTYQLATLSADAQANGGMKEFGNFLEAKKNEGDTTYQGMEADASGYRAAVKAAQANGKTGDFAELLSIAGENVSPQNELPQLQQMSEGQSEPSLEGGGPVMDGTQDKAAGMMADGAQSTIQGTGGATDAQKRQIDKQGGGNLTAEQKKAAAQSAAITSNGGISTKEESRMRDQLNDAGINTSKAGNGNQLAVATANMGKYLDEGMSGQKAFDKALEETSAMADLGQSVAEQTSAAEGAAPLTNQDTGENVGTGNNTGTDTGTNTGANTGTDTGANTGTNTGANTGTDTGTDTGTNTGANTGTDTGANTGTNTGANTGTDTGTDTGTNTGANTGTDTGNGTGTGAAAVTETGTDTGTDTGTGSSNGDTSPPAGSGSNSGSGAQNSSAGNNSSQQPKPNSKPQSKKSGDQGKGDASGGQNGEPVKDSKGLNFTDSKGFNGAEELLNEKIEKLSQDGEMNLSSIDPTERQQAAQDWMEQNPEVTAENMTAEQAKELTEIMTGKDLGDGPETDQATIDGEKQTAMDNSDLERTGGMGKALGDFLSSDMASNIMERSADGSQAGAAAGAVISGAVGAAAARSAGTSILKGMLQGAATGTLRGAGIGTLAGAAYGALEGYSEHQDAQQIAAASEELAAASADGNYSAITNASQDQINRTLEGVVAKQVIAMEEAQVQGQDFDQQEFYNSLDAFEQQVYDQGNALMTDAGEMHTGQRYGDGMGQDFSEAIDNSYAAEQATQEEYRTGMAGGFDSMTPEQREAMRN